MPLHRIYPGVITPEKTEALVARTDPENPLAHLPIEAGQFFEITEFAWWRLFATREGIGYTGTAFAFAHFLTGALTQSAHRFHSRAAVVIIAWEGPDSVKEAHADLAAYLGAGS